MYQEIKDYFKKRGHEQLFSECIEKIHYTDKGIELYCGSNSNNATIALNVIEEGICDGDLKKSGEVRMESGKGLTTWIIVDKKTEEEEEQQ